ncbi:16S rRNA (guanine(966)-N(2))-methyltransferase RsmD [Microbacterium oleivorans]|uniref:16S rRNA (guanine(966)-N(2))-methyltransferase RsmD n=1 Tax=Microbacterium oleivorans TaxID=273677 RepID=UPI002040137D|nr:16S rRNA (guanine(966)-N(2))-methyltransferase RsmD [Microbacterium oleivorans]MCM3696842.1 16S rRNA (guanine(966)-N(2))-methyltransferase RsmD [Microbacterium oleivorans]
MTRIIAGDAGSLPLAVPSAGTRPTSERVRESLFGALEAAGILTGAAVLDLYAGSGALGLEAVSRGAASADLVERAPRAASVIDRNVRAVARSLPGRRVTVHRAAADAFLRSGGQGFDLVFVDPPYDMTDAELSTTLGLLVPRLAATATVIVERATRSGAPLLPEHLVLDRSKKYGDTTLWWLAPSAPDQPLAESQSA